jgi:hypothetical protein
MLMGRFPLPGPSPNLGEGGPETAHYRVYEEGSGTFRVSPLPPGRVGRMHCVTMQKTSLLVQARSWLLVMADQTTPPLQANGARAVFGQSTIDSRRQPPILWQRQRY